MVLSSTLAALFFKAKTLRKKEVAQRQDGNSFPSFAMQEIEPMVLCMVGRPSTTKVHPVPRTEIPIHLLRSPDPLTHLRTPSYPSLELSSKQSHQL